MVTPVVVYEYDGVTCVTMFEVYYPAVTFALAVIAIACFRGFYAVPLHPSTFKFLRLKYRLAELKVKFHVFETGTDQVRGGPCSLLSPLLPPSDCVLLRLQVEPVPRMLLREGIINTMDLTDSEAMLEAYEDVRRGDPSFAPCSHPITPHTSCCGGAGLHRP